MGSGLKFQHRHEPGVLTLKHQTWPRNPEALLNYLALGARNRTQRQFEMPQESKIIFILNFASLSSRFLDATLIQETTSSGSLIFNDLSSQFPLDMIFQKNLSRGN